MRKLIQTIFLMSGIWFILTLAANAQTTDCPADKVCLDRDQAAKYLVIEDTLKATEKENLALRQAVLDKSIEILNVKIELARVMGEKTGSDQAVVRLTAEVEFLNKNGRKKCGLFSICIQ